MILFVFRASYAEQKVSVCVHLVIVKDTNSGYRGAEWQQQHGI